MVGAGLLVAGPGLPLPAEGFRVTPAELFAGVEDAFCFPFALALAGALPLPLAGFFVRALAGVFCFFFFPIDAGCRNGRATNRRVGEGRAGGGREVVCKEMWTQWPTMF